MSTLVGAIGVLAIALGATGAAAGQDQAQQQCEPGAPGVGDEYFPTYGNGGYDVRNYDLDVAYDPATDVVEGERDDPGTCDPGACAASTSTSWGWRFTTSRLRARAPSSRATARS
jgi:hypothetical protein